MEGDTGNSEQAARDRIWSAWPVQPQAVVILGTGLGRLANFVRHEAVLPYADLPGFARSTALGHRGRLICGTLRNTPLLLLDGRCHLYEGYSLQQITLPIRVAHACGARLLIATNASGGLNPDYASGDIMVMDDHINLLIRTILPQPPSATAGRPERAIASPYDEQLISQTLQVAQQQGFTAHRGVYVAMTGPNYETRAEYRFLRSIGGDAVGMSTVPEVDMACALGMRALGLSIVTNVARPDSPEVVCATDVIRAAERAEPNVRKIMAQVVAHPWLAADLRAASVQRRLPE